MTKWGFALAGLLSAMTAYAQDATPAPEAAAPAAEAAPATEPAPAADAAAPAAEVSAPAADAGTTETVAVDGATPPPADASAERKPWRFYAGYDYSQIRFSIYQSNPGATTAPTLKQKFGGDSFTSNFHQLRFGTRLFEFVGVEAHYGVGGGNSGSGSVSTDNNYGLYVLPTGVFFNTVEISAVVGYTWIKLSNATASASFDGVSYGLNAEVPLKHFFESLPDIRVGGGGMLYHKANDAQVYGAHLGLRYDFKI